MNNINEVFTNNKLFLCNKERLNEVIKEYSFVSISNNSELDKTIIKNIEDSSLFVIDQYNIKNDHQEFNYFIISFKKTIILIEPSFLYLLQSHFANKKELKIYFLTQIKDIFDQYIQIKYIYNDNEINQPNFSIEISAINQLIKINRLKLFDNSIIDLLKIVRSCISGYLIKQSYEKTNKNRFAIFHPRLNEIKDNFCSADDFIELRVLGIGYVFQATLIYHIEKEEIFVIKKENRMTNELSKLNERELSNYSCIDYPFFPQFFGKVKNTDFPVIEFINGNLLQNIKESKFNEEDKIFIIFQLIAALQYLHDNGYIYRDLKPNNIIVDKNKSVIIIDFDRMIKLCDVENSQDITLDFGSNYIAPELIQGKLSFKNDIFSLGQVIYFIMEEKTPEIKNNEEMKNLRYDSPIQKIFETCTNEDENERPTILDLFFAFYINYHSQIESFMESDGKFIYKELEKYKNYFNTAIKYYINIINEKDTKALINLGCIYRDGEFIERDINKSIHYFILAANQNDARAQYYLGVFYFEGNYIPRNINKAIHYFTLAANQNNVNAQSCLGAIYFGGLYTNVDIDKAIYYYTLAANQNDPDALFNLGIIYEDGEYVERDMNKAISFYTLAADQNHSDAQYNLGIIYEDGEYVQRDINKAISFYTQAANQNHTSAQFNLGMIFDEGKYISKDINKAIHYYTLAADQNHLEAQYNLGLIFDEGKYVSRDINKAIYFYTLAANQNHSIAQFNLSCLYMDEQNLKQDIAKSFNYCLLAAKQNNHKAQFNLGLFYYQGKYVKHDINKAINYLSLSAKQNNKHAMFHLAVIYNEGKYVPRDIERAIYYYQLSANKNLPESNYNLGLIYDEGQYVKQDITKAIHYYSLAADQNLPHAQFRLGLIYENNFNIDKAIYYYSLAASNNFDLAQLRLGEIYFQGKYVICDINKAVHYFNLSSNNDNRDAFLYLGIIYLWNGEINKSINFLQFASKKGNILSNFFLGFLYHEGRYIQKDIPKAIHYYKEASSFNNEFAKNNLGILFKNGVDDELQKNLFSAIEYFDEAIRQENNKISMYNLAHIYLFNDTIDIDKSIDLLIQSSNQDFLPSQELLCLALIKKYGSDLVTIKEILDKQLNHKSNIIYKIMIKQELYKDTSFIKTYQYYKNIDFLYNDSFQPIQSNEVVATIKNFGNNVNYNLTSEFYDGFGHDILI